MSEANKALLKGIGEHIRDFQNRPQEANRANEALAPLQVLATSDEKDYYEKFSRSILDQSREYPLPIPLVNLYQSGELIPLFTLKSFSLIQGKQKSKKTTGLALFVAAVIAGIADQSTDPYISPAEEGRVIFFDNEQGESYAARTMKLILKLAGVDSSIKFIYCDLREHSPQERKRIIEAGIKGTPNVRLVVIDGLVDLMNDFMDAGEAHQVVTEILKWCSTYNVHISGVLHQNKGDKNARAHIGTISSQKCEIEISAEVDGDDTTRSVISCINSRGIPFKPFAIGWEKGSLPKICDDWNAGAKSNAAANKSFERNKEVAEYVFKPGFGITHKDAVSGIMTTTLKSKSTAKRLLEDFIEWKLVTKGNDGNYRINLQ